MRFAAVVVMAATAGASAWPAESGRRSVTVCVTSGREAQVVSIAQRTASEMFVGIGIRIDWRAGGSCSSPSAIKINLSYETPETLAPAALAYARPYEGTHIVIFYDRVKERVQPYLVPQLLAHVLVHEVTHVLQRINRHSATGIMKAHWDKKDFAEMAQKPLSFTSEDVLLINLGLGDPAPRELDKEPRPDRGPALVS